MTFAAGRHGDGALTTEVLAITLDHSSAGDVPGPLRRVAMVISDLLLAVAVIFAIPFVILAIGTPVALVARLLLWVGGML